MVGTRMYFFGLLFEKYGYFLVKKIIFYQVSASMWPTLGKEIQFFDIFLVLALLVAGTLVRQKKLFFRSPISRGRDPGKKNSFFCACQPSSCRNWYFVNKIIFLCVDLPFANILLEKNNFFLGVDYLIASTNRLYILKFSILWLSFIIIIIILL